MCESQRQATARSGIHEPLWRPGVCGVGLCRTIRTSGGGDKGGVMCGVWRVRAAWGADDRWQGTEPARGGCVAL